MIGYFDSKKLVAGYFNSKKIINIGEGPEPVLTGLKFTATQANSTIAYQVTGSLPNIHIQTSLDGVVWTNWDGLAISLDLNESIYIRNTVNTLSTSTDNYLKFVMTGKIKASGDIGSMINYADLSNYCYLHLFDGCSSLIESMPLPATTLKNHCYGYMFQGCTSLTQAPALPATTLVLACYEYMFKGCTALVNPPVLPATTIAGHCYSHMFEGCSKLEIAPTLPATTMYDYCYYAMFNNCSKLINAPALPATTLGVHCYRLMFRNCTSLTAIPSLTVTTLKDGCYYGMFSGCSKIKMSETGTGSPVFVCPSTTGITDPVTDMFVNTSGSFVGTPVAGTSYYYYVYTGLKFTSRQTGTQLAYAIVGTIPTVHMQISYDDGITWSDWDGRTLYFTGATSNATICVRNTSNSLSLDISNYLYFKSGDGKLVASGSVGSLINYSSLYNYCFCRLFYGCKYLIEAPELPATTLANGCYYAMFEGCSRLTVAPTLPSFVMKDSCYKRMFYECTSLVEAPDLPATTLSSFCYEQMFAECSALTTISPLPALTMFEGCYSYMFYNCAALTTAPTLPATTLAKDCYAYMFTQAGVTNLPELNVSTLADGCYQYMFFGCTALLNNSKEYTLPATTLTPNCYNRMFYGCSSLVAIPKLLATTLANGSCQRMFMNCSKIEIEENGAGETIFTCPSTEGLDNPVTQMFAGTNGTFTANPTTGNRYTRFVIANYLKFTAVENSIIYFEIVGSIECHLQTSVDGIHWTDWNLGVRRILNTGDFIYVKNTLNTLSVNLHDNYFRFIMTGKIAASGNTHSMINFAPLSYACFGRLFENCDALITPPELPATTLTKYCYQYMFTYCSSLTQAPALPATELLEGCYKAMFRGCSSLKVNENGTGTKIFKCPPVSGGSSFPVRYMFENTGGTFAGDPTEGNTYYWYE